MRTPEQSRTFNRPSVFFSYFGIALTLWCYDAIAQTPFETATAVEGHCSEVRGNPYNQTVACLVWDRKPEFRDPLQIEIYRPDSPVRIVEPGTPIREWHFWNEGKLLAIHSGARDGPEIYALYDTTTGLQVEKVHESVDVAHLPQWAKSQSQLEDESVPESSLHTQQRTLWVAKVLRQLSTVHPGMTRKDLIVLLTTEGGISNRFQRTYVSLACPYVKVDIRFKAKTGDTDALNEDPEDIIESVSRPYLAWSVAD